MEINDDRLDILISEIEKVRRRKIINATNNDTIEYFDPLDNLSKIKTPNNHLIVGRRGSGKTTLLLTTIKKENEDLIVPKDCQIYRKNNEVFIVLDLLEVITTKLVKSFEIIQDFKLQEIDYNKKYKGYLNQIKNLFQKKKDIHKYEEYLLCKSALNNIIYCIKELQKLPDTPITIDTKLSNKNISILKKINTNDSKLTAKFIAQGKLSNYYSSISSNLEGIAHIAEQVSQYHTIRQENEENTSFKKLITKQEKTNDLKHSIAELFSEFTRLTNKKIVLYLDDFYLIPLEIQPYVIQYIHDIYKNTEYDSFSFKLCTIPNRTRLNELGNVDFSIKDDFSPIRLDKELYDFYNLKDFLLRITSNLCPNIALTSTDINSLFNNDDVLNYTVVSTGGVPRDFIVTLSELIKIARAEHSSTIKKEHLYSAVSDLKEDKEQNIELEADIDPTILRAALGIIEEEIITGKQTNVILYPAQLVKEHEHLLKNLVNLRYLHIINENTSSEKVKKENFVSYLIDMTFYATGKRLKQGFTFRQFWETDSNHRHIHLRNAPIWSFDMEKLYSK